MNFNPEINRQEKPNTPKGEHLKSGDKPIIGGIYDRNNLDQETEYFLDGFKKNAEFVDFYAKEDILNKNKFLNSGKETYVISPCDSRDKYSLTYLDCTGVVVVGRDSQTGENISFMSHQNPESFLADSEIRNSLEKDFKNNIDSIVKKSIPGSIDVVAFGGIKEDISSNLPDDNFRVGIDDSDIFMKGPYDNYIKSIKFLKKWSLEKLGLEPVVMTGPNTNLTTNNHSLSVYFDNKNRRLYMIRPKQSESVKNEPFTAGEVENQVRKINR